MEENPYKTGAIMQSVKANFDVKIWCLKNVFS